ncbi:Rrf2 family transcriptional regulator [Paenibacillus sp. FSL W8-1187]|uniref:Rrf2 family transcriptional regulator n=1 Tax=Paenibacillus pasadenensis TaxID=217090 RepID=A0A2N5N4J4_9BACL|nr:MULTISPECIES: Rrf2 family transcriptional regulator [Paenibacillus]PLT45258.1 Rrf2 family transcriptional regulator [Paenibacillus pasadenensis]QGG55645.1 Rrf2 family transcriptional regulator [Paenibacillus sp. B01]
MKYSKATDYALHTMLFLALGEREGRVGVGPLAERMQVSPTYLSKILTKLVKDGLVESSPGVSGGYRLRRSAGDIALLDIIQAIEGKTSLYECSGVHHHPGCLIHQAMAEAEHRMEAHLASVTIADLARQQEQRALS